MTGDGDQSDGIILLDADLGGGVVCSSGEEVMLHYFCQSMVAISAAVTAQQLHTPFTGKHQHKIGRGGQICRNLSRPDLDIPLAWLPGRVWNAFWWGKKHDKGWDEEERVRIEEWKRKAFARGITHISVWKYYKGPPQRPVRGPAPTHRRWGIVAWPPHVLRQSERAFT
jgi:hypothetical protein